MWIWNINRLSTLEHVCICAYVHAYTYEWCMYLKRWSVISWCVCTKRRYERAYLKYKNETQSFQTHVRSTRACSTHLVHCKHFFQKQIYIEFIGFILYKVIVAFFIRIFFNSTYFAVAILQVLNLFTWVLEPISIKEKLPEIKMPIQNNKSLEKMSKTDTMKMRNRYIGWVMPFLWKYFRSLVISKKNFFIAFFRLNH